MSRYIFVAIYLIKARNADPPKFVDHAQAEKILGLNLDSNLRSKSNEFNVSFHGRGGLKLQASSHQQSHYSRKITRDRKEIGTNDLCDVSVSPQQLATCRDPC